MNTRTVQDLSAMYRPTRYVQQSGAGYSVRHYHRSNVDCCFTDRGAAIARTTGELSIDSVAVLSGPAAAATFVSILYSSAFHRYYLRQGYSSALVL